MRNGQTRLAYAAQCKSYMTSMCGAALGAAYALQRRLTRLATTTLMSSTAPDKAGHVSAIRASQIEGTIVTIVAHLPSDAWCDVLRTVQISGCTIVHLESQPSASPNGCSSDLLVDIRVPDDAEARRMALQSLESLGPNVSVLKGLEEPPVGQGRQEEAGDKPVWFPRRQAELDQVVNSIFKMAEDSIDHPSMRDEHYQERRRMFTKLAFEYKHDQPIPLVDYTDEENGTWSTVFNRLCDLYDKHACKEFLENFRHLRDVGLYRRDRIPQLRDVSDFVKRRSGFALRPVAGYLSARDFLSALALRVFCCTQYIRHWEKPFYTPEPDCCHELLGHVPMLADPTFAHFSQEIGLASLGASDEDVKKLATYYFFTVEFGFCKEADQLKVYGAGLLACVDEFTYAVSGGAEILELDPELLLQQECKVTTFQDIYFYTSSFAEAKDKLRRFARTLRRQHNLVYNPYTQSIEDASSAYTGRGLHAVTDLLTRVCWDLEAAQQSVCHWNL